MTVLSHHKRLSLLIAGSLLAGATLSPVMAAEMAGQKVQVRGVVESVNGQQLTIKSREGSEVSVAMKPGAMVSAVAKASIRLYSAVDSGSDTPSASTSVRSCVFNSHPAKA